MKSVHWREASKIVLRKVASERRFGLISDVDGTLSSIVENPDEARISSEMRELLAELNRGSALVALVSGRGVEDLRQRVGLPGLVYVGNHGLERWTDGQSVTHPEAASQRPALEAVKAKLAEFKDPGLSLEDKGSTLTLHYRRHTNPDGFAKEQRDRFTQIAGDLGLRLSQGRMVFEFKPSVAVDKGSTLRQLVADYRLGAALYIGDDTTDVAALLAAKDLREGGKCESWGVGVQSDETPDEVVAAADLLASGVPDVEALLGWLLRARKASST